MIEPYLWVLLAHYLADYPLQGDFLAQTKGVHWYSLWAHCVIYSLTVALCLKLLGLLALWKVAILLTSHIVIDYKKATAKDKTKALALYLYLDQACHITIAFACVALR
jgi:hypothetical protein